jgi:stage V sporulation protein SpoVS
MTHHGAFNQDSHTVGAVFEIRFIEAGIEAFVATVGTTVALVDAWLILRIESHERTAVDVQTFPCSSGIVHK